MTKTEKTIVTIILAIVIIALVAGIGYAVYSVIRKNTMEVVNPKVSIEIEKYGTMKFELYPEIAPNTVANFIKLAENGYYNGLTVHEVIKDVMVQMGGQNETGQVKPVLSNIESELTSYQKAENMTLNSEYSIEGEFIANGHNKNTLKMDRGTLAMFRSDFSSLSSGLSDEGYNSGAAQFFIVTQARSSLDGLYCGFGKLIEGDDVLTKLSEVEVKNDEEDTSGAQATTPVETIRIKSITVDRGGIDYGTPTTQIPFDYTNWIMQQYYSQN